MLPPVVGRYRVIPLIAEGATANVRSEVARPDVQTALGLPGTLVPDWHDKAIQRLGELVRERRGIARVSGQLHQVWCLHRQVSLFSGYS